MPIDSLITSVNALELRLTAAQLALSSWQNPIGLEPYKAEIESFQKDIDAILHRTTRYDECFDGFSKDAAITASEELAESRDNHDKCSRALRAQGVPAVVAKAGAEILHLVDPERPPLQFSIALAPCEPVSIER